MTSNSLKLVILDRDGVINQDHGTSVNSVDQWLPIPGSIEAIAELSQAGFTVLVATNQPGVARGLFDLDDLEAIHAKLGQLVEEKGGAVAAIFYCPHDHTVDCNCRKPKSGLIDAIEAEFDTCAQGVPLVGDAPEDLLAGISKGCVPILVRTGQGQVTEDALKLNPINGLTDLHIFDNLKDAVPFIKSVYGQA